ASLTQGPARRIPLCRRMPRNSGSSSSGSGEQGSSRTVLRHSRADRFFAWTSCLAASVERKRNESGKHCSKLEPCRRVVENRPSAHAGTRWAAGAHHERQPPRRPPRAARKVHPAAAEARPRRKRSPPPEVCEGAAESAANHTLASRRGSQTSDDTWWAVPKHGTPQTRQPVANRCVGGLASRRGFHISVDTRWTFADDGTPQITQSMASRCVDGSIAGGAGSMICSGCAGGAGRTAGRPGKPRLQAVRWPHIGVSQ
ncbi:unnamed protein product, partial [Prorocentrum cordatum]